MTTTTVPVLIVGGGIGGLATALSIASHGRRVHVLERAEKFTEIGAGLQFGPNASRALDVLGVFDDIRPLALAPRQAVMRDAVTGGVLTTLEFGAKFERRYGYPYLAVHRGDLLDALAARCRAHELVTLEAQRNVVEAGVRADGATVTCSEGSVYDTEALIAADGLHSALRGKVVDDTAICSGFAAYRSTVSADEAGSALAPDEVHLVGRARNPHDSVPAARRRAFQPGRRVPQQKVPRRTHGPGRMGHRRRARRGVRQGLRSGACGGIADRT
jgi:salicylate hydroxylase